MPRLTFSESEVKALLEVATGAAMREADNLRDFTDQVTFYEGNTGGNEKLAETYRELAEESAAKHAAIQGALETLDDAHERGRRKIATARRR